MKEETEELNETKDSVIMLADKADYLGAWPRACLISFIIGVGNALTMYPK